MKARAELKQRTADRSHEVGVGSMLGQYRVEAEIGRGGMGVVFRAVHVGIGQLAAVKVLLAKRGDDPSYLRRFTNEARAISRVDHPGLVKLFDFGKTAGGAPYILMEHLAGDLLRARHDRLRRSGKALDLVSATRVARQVASALATTHARGIVHRDLKPENLMLVADDEAPGGERVKVLDFGIAHLTTERTTETAPGTVIGTAAYMSPEQCAGDAQLDGRSDVYSLGVVLYEMLAGAPPFRGTSRRSSAATCSTRRNRCKSRLHRPLRRSPASSRACSRRSPRAARTWPRCSTSCGAARAARRARARPTTAR